MGEAASCQGLAPSCGPQANEDCCASLALPGGSFDRYYDGVHRLTRDAPATLSALRLDRFEITVGRMRRFVAAWVAGYRPAAGAGKHSHVAGGLGLSSTSGEREKGWDPAWAADWPTTSLEWDRRMIECGSGIWVTDLGDRENWPACLSWTEAYAFCVWDGGFLPTESEWLFAAAGGDEERAYPWSAPPTSIASAGCAVVNLSGCSASMAVGLHPGGDGRYGHADLQGNMTEWVLDYHFTVPAVCDDCFNVEPTGQQTRVLLGAHSGTDPGCCDPAPLSRLARDGMGPTDQRWPAAGARCARAP